MRAVGLAGRAIQKLRRDDTLDFGKFPCCAGYAPFGKGSNQISAHPIDYRGRCGGFEKLLGEDESSIGHQSPAVGATHAPAAMKRIEIIVVVGFSKADDEVTG